MTVVTIVIVAARQSESIQVASVQTLSAGACWMTTEARCSRTPCRLDCELIARRRPPHRAAHRSRAGRREPSDVARTCPAPGCATPRRDATAVGTAWLSTFPWEGPACRACRRGLSTTPDSFCTCGGADLERVLIESVDRTCATECRRWKREPQREMPVVPHRPEFGNHRADGSANAQRTGLELEVRQQQGTPIGHGHDAACRDGHGHCRDWNVLKHSGETKDFVAGRHSAVDEERSTHHVEIGVRGGLSHGGDRRMHQLQVAACCARAVRLEAAIDLIHLDLVIT